jgi:glycerol dehydrogenase
MVRVFGAPSRYVQGPGVLAQLGEWVGTRSNRPLIVADAVVTQLLHDDLMSGLGSLADATRLAPFNGECTSDEIARIAAMAGDADVVIGVGGGKAIDTAKSVSIAIGQRVIIVPTVASNDSPTSRLAVLYTSDHVLSEVRLMQANPDLVLVDTAIIARAPERFFVAGIGDALSKKFEAAQCFAAKGQNFHKAHPPYLALTLGEACYTCIRQHAEGALLALRAGAPDDAFERVVEATILMSGLAFESGGLSIAHAVLRGMSTVPELNGALHGEQVAFGLIVQLILECRAQGQIEELLAFYQRIGLPRTLKALGYPGPAIKIAATVAQHTWANAPYVRNLSQPIDAARLERAIVQADLMGSRIA